MTVKSIKSQLPIDITDINVVKIIPECRSSLQFVFKPWRPQKPGPSHSIEVPS